MKSVVRKMSSAHVIKLVVKSQSQIHSHGIFLQWRDDCLNLIFRQGWKGVWRSGVRGNMGWKTAIELGWLSDQIECYKNICSWRGPYSFSSSLSPSTYTRKTTRAYICNTYSGWPYSSLTFIGCTPSDHIFTSSVLYLLAGEGEEWWVGGG